MTSSPGLRGLSRLQARRGVLQTTTDATAGSSTLYCVGGPVTKERASRTLCQITAVKLYLEDILHTYNDCRKSKCQRRTNNKSSIF